MVNKYCRFLFHDRDMVIIFFAMQYTSLKISVNKYLIYFAVLFNTVFLIAAIFNQIITDVNITPYGASITQATILYDVHILQANSFAIVSLIILNYKKRKLDESEKNKFQ